MACCMSPFKVCCKMPSVCPHLLFPCGPRCAFTVPGSANPATGRNATYSRTSVCERNASLSVSLSLFCFVSFFPSFHPSSSPFSSFVMIIFSLATVFVCHSLPMPLAKKPFNGTKEGKNGRKDKSEFIDASSCM